MKTLIITLLVVLLSGCHFSKACQGSSGYFLVPYQSQDVEYIFASQKDVKKIKSYSIQGWIQPLLNSQDQSFSSFLQDGGTIFGISSNNYGWGLSNKDSDTFLYALLKPPNQKEGFAVMYESKKTLQELFNPKAMNDLIGRWFFLYAAYHSDINKVYFAVKDLYQNNYSEQWSDNKIVRNSITTGGFGFSAGFGGSKSQKPMLARIKLVCGDYSSLSKYYKNTSEIDGFLKQQSSDDTPTLPGPTYQVAEIIIKPLTDISVQTYKYDSGEGADEYSIQGFLKLPDFSANDKDMLLFRVSTNDIQKTGSQYIEGDRALYGYLEKGTKICFATYSLSTKGSDANITTCFPEAIPGTNLFFFYQGYSRQLKRVISLIKTWEKEFKIINESIFHLVPERIYVQFGSDSLTSQLTGKCQKCLIQFGKGSYVEKITAILPPPEVVIPKTYANAALVTSDSSSLKAVKLAIVEDKYQSAVKQYAIHFWYRRDLLNPNAADLNAVRKNVQAIAGVTEKASYTNVGDEALSITYRPHSSGSKPAYLFTFAIDSGSSLAVAVEFPQSEDQGEWHWIYFGYNQQTSEASYSVTLGDGTTVTKALPGLSRAQSKALKALFGGSGTTTGAPGEFFDLQFVYYDGCYVSTTNAVKTYFKTYVASPPSRSPIPASYEYLNSATFSETQKPESTPLLVQNNGSEITDYSIQTWATWTHAASKTDKESVLLSSSLIKPDATYNLNKLGNVVLQISVSSAGVIFTTYNYGYVSSSDSPALSQTIALKDYIFDDQWCFYYFGYSRKTSSARGFINCDNGFTEEVSFKNIVHIISNSVYFSVAQTPISNQWYGSLYKPTFVVVKDLQTDLTVNPDRPEKVTDCSSVFSQCGYVNEITKICENKDSFSLKEVKSVYVPKGLAIVFYKKANFKGIYVSFVDSVECLDMGLAEDASVQWSKLASLFQSGKIVFSNEKGDQLTLHQAKAQFLGKRSLKKKSLIHQKILKDEEESAQN